MRSSRSRSGSRASATPLLASLALHAATFAALARMERGETREAVALGFEAGIAVAWVPADDAVGEEATFAEPAPLVEPRFTLPAFPSLEGDLEPPSLEPDPSFTDLPVVEEPAAAELLPLTSPPWR